MFDSSGTVGAFGAGTGAAAVKTPGYGLVIQSGADEFLIVGQGVSVTFAAKASKVEIDSAQEGTFKDGRWTPGRTLNGDERYALFPHNSLRVVRVKLLRR